MKFNHSNARRSVLVGLARRCRIDDADAACGRCLSASLELALAAHRRGIAVTLVRWKVRGDADFVDHWAVRLDGRNVLDLTRVQVDGTRRLVVDIDDYPAGYGDRREYPASLFLVDFVQAVRAGADLLSGAVMLRIARSMFRFDAMTALRGWFPVRAARLAFELLGAHVRVGHHTLSRHLQERREGLMRRIG